MPKDWYSYRLKRRIPLLNEAEWKQVFVSNPNPLKALKTYRENTGRTLKESHEDLLTGEFQTEALVAYETLTGEKLHRVSHIYAVRMAGYGPPCPGCTKPFRTPRAKYCAECGLNLPKGQVAASLGKLEDH